MCRVTWENPLSRRNEPQCREHSSPSWTCADIDLVCHLVQTVLHPETASSVCSPSRPPLTLAVEICQDSLHHWSLLGKWLEFMGRLHGVGFSPPAAPDWYVAEKLGL